MINGPVIIITAFKYKQGYVVAIYRMNLFLKLYLTFNTQFAGYKN